MCPMFASDQLEMATPGDRMFFSFLYLILTYNRIIVFQALQLSHRKVIMNFVNILIEHYDLDKLETLSNEEIKILLTEISFGLEFLSFEKISQNACDEINSKNLPLLNNLGSEAENRKILTESDLIKSFLAEYEKCQKNIENVHQKKIKIKNCDSEITSENSCENKGKSKTLMMKLHLKIMSPVKKKLKLKRIKQMKTI